MKKTEAIKYLRTAKENLQFTVEVKDTRTGETGVASLMNCGKVFVWLNSSSNKEGYNDYEMSQSEFINNFIIERCIDESDSNNTVIMQFRSDNKAEYYAAADEESKSEDEADITHYASKEVFEKWLALNHQWAKEGGDRVRNLDDIKATFESKEDYIIKLNGVYFAKVTSRTISTYFYGEEVKNLTIEEAAE